VALLCDDCTHMQKHCEDHGWWFSKDDPKHWTQVSVQTFFGNAYQRYFIVASKGSPADVSTPAVSAKADEDVLLRDQLLREFNDTDEHDRKRLEVADLRTEKSDNTGWWNFVQWRPHFSGRNIRRIAYASRLPDRRDKLLLRAAEIVSLMIKRAVDGLSSLHDDTPYWLRTANSTEKVENRPMVRLQNEESLDRYITYFRRFACYLLRVYVVKREQEKAAGESEDRSSDGSSSEVESSEGSTEDSTAEEGEDGIASEASSEDAGDTAQPEKGTAAVDPMKDCCELTVLTAEQEQLLQELYELLESRDDEEEQTQKMMAVLMSMIMQSLKGLGRFDSPIVHFAAVLGIVEDESRSRRMHGKFIRSRNRSRIVRILSPGISPAGIRRCLKTRLGFHGPTVEKCDHRAQ
jgi:hypothetical protein